VAVFVGMHTANQSALSAFSRTVDRIAGKTELEVTAGEPGFDEGILERVQGAATVRGRAGDRGDRRHQTDRGRRPGNLLVLGIDMTGDRSLRDYDLESGDEAVVDDPLVFLAQPDSIILSKEFADHQSPRRGTAADARHGPGRQAVHDPRDAKSTGLASAYGGNLDHGHLRCAEDVRARADVRSDRSRVQAGTHHRRDEARS
jgi:putative ABC transport system permease protein